MIMSPSSGEFVIAVHYQRKSTFEGLYRHVSVGDILIHPPSSVRNKGLESLIPRAAFIEEFLVCSRECKAR